MTNPAPASAPARPEVDPLDPCDKHRSAAPKWAILLAGAEHPMLLCAHCWNEHAVKLLSYEGAQHWPLADRNER